MVPAAPAGCSDRVQRVVLSFVAMSDSSFVCASGACKKDVRTRRRVLTSFLHAPEAHTNEESLMATKDSTTRWTLSEHPAGAAGTIHIGDQLEVNRMGYGAM